MAISEEVKQYMVVALPEMYRPYFLWNCDIFTDNELREGNVEQIGDRLEELNEFTPTDLNTIIDPEILINSYKIAEEQLTKKRLDGKRKNRNDAVIQSEVDLKDNFGGTLINPQDIAGPQSDTPALPLLVWKFNRKLTREDMEMMIYQAYAGKNHPPPCNNIEDIRELIYQHFDIIPGKDDTFKGKLLVKEKKSEKENEDPKPLFHFDGNTVYFLEKDHEMNKYMAASTVQSLMAGGAKTIRLNHLSDELLVHSLTAFLNSPDKKPETKVAVTLPGQTQPATIADLKSHLSNITITKCKELANTLINQLTADNLDGRTPSGLTKRRRLREEAQQPDTPARSAKSAKSATPSGAPCGNAKLYRR